MVSVQAEGCAPIPKAFAEGKDVSVRFEHAHTYASGLRVPKAYADYLILKILRASKGEALTVTDDEMRRGVNELASSEGLFAAPEGGAAWEAVKKLVAAGKVDRGERVGVFDTGTAYKDGEGDPPGADLPGGGGQPVGDGFLPHRPLEASRAEGGVRAFGERRAHESKRLPCVFHARALGLRRAARARRLGTRDRGGDAP